MKKTQVDKILNILPIKYYTKHCLNITHFFTSRALEDFCVPKDQKSNYQRSSSDVTIVKEKKKKKSLNKSKIFRSHRQNRRNRSKNGRERWPRRCLPADLEQYLDSARSRSVNRAEEMDWSGGRTSKVHGNLLVKLHAPRLERLSDSPKTVTEPFSLLSSPLSVGKCRREPRAKPTATTANATVSEISCCRRRRPTSRETLEEVCPERDCANLLHFGVKLICPRARILLENLIPFLSYPSRLSLAPLKSHPTGNPSQGSSGNLAVFVGVARPQERREAFREVLPVRNAREGAVRFN